MYKYNTLLLIILFSPFLFSQQLSPEQQSLLQGMSAEEQASLAQQIGVSIPGSNSSQNSGTTLGQPGQAATVKQQDPYNISALSKENSKNNLYIQKLTDSCRTYGFITKSAIAACVQREISAQPLRSKRYGLNFFTSQVSTFAPTDNAQVSASYILGVGDSLTIQLYGTQNRKLNLQIERDGSIVLPSIGSIILSGLTFTDARNQIVKKVSDELFGVNAIVTMGRIKAINIFMAGEVVIPGKYSMSGLATVTQALYQSGGITDIGSLRNIQVLREGTLFTTFDAYQLLMSGDASGDIQLQSGDVVLVPQYLGLAEVEGEVKRPMIYEITPDDTIQNLLKMAGLFTESAFPTQSTLIRTGLEGVNSQVTSLNLYNVEALNIPLIDGDHLLIMQKSEELTKNITLKGAVNRPGDYGWKKDMRVSDLITDMRRDLTIDTDLSFSLIVRNKNSLREISTYKFSLRDVINSPRSSKDPVLSEFDEILIFSKTTCDPLNSSHQVIPQCANLLSEARVNTQALPTKDDLDEIESAEQDVDSVDDTQSGRNLVISQLSQNEEQQANHETLNELFANNRASLLGPIIEKIKLQSSNFEHLQLISVSGGVLFPGTYPLFENATLQDLIEAAGGLTDMAFLGAAELRRITLNSDQVESSFFEYSIDPTYINKQNPLLQSRDHVTIRQMQDAFAKRAVKINGAVRFPGEYMISKGETISMLVARAGGILDEGFAEGSQFFRTSIALNEEVRAKEYAQQIRQLYSSRLLTEEKNNTTFEDVYEIADLLEDINGRGRMVIDLPSIINDDNEADIVLENGDTLFIPNMLNSISVIGEVNRSATIVYDPSMRTQDYLRFAGGTTARADEKSIYIIKASGAIEVLEKGFWSLGRQNPKFLPGDTLVVPIKATYKDGLSQWTEITQLIYQSMVSIAAVKGL
ncbi:SLBB domain-containing protein [Gammaproteobacteria bacterium]|nr:SLBB domain-containing protein [Gammaproteobacteria bacterium]